MIIKKNIYFKKGFPTKETYWDFGQISKKRWTKIFLINTGLRIGCQQTNPKFYAQVCWHLIPKFYAQVCWHLIPLSPYPQKNKHHSYLKQGGNLFKFTISLEYHYFRDKLVGHSYLIFPQVARCFVL